ncbi:MULTISPECIES: PP2C family protein-serine/threonine phosphatase [unclassified Nonomuraea]|uniref:PP2C family protein-serine/threonine phosphatase n=1 Tax=unclassified Nonomuraea TaxID=2593643 RepID=UPI0035C1022C
MTEMTHCVSCGGGAVAPDGRCWDCGHAQPAFRAHLELTVDGGAAGVSDRGLRRAVNADAMALTRMGAWTVGVVCDGVSMSPRSERAAQVAAEAGAAATAARLRAGALPETALTEGALMAGRAVAALAGIRTAHPPTAPAAPGTSNATLPTGPATRRPTSAVAPAEAITSLAAAELGAPACTYVAGVAGPEGVWSCWVGDSRAYWLPDEGTGMALTEDDTGEHEALSAWLGADAGAPEPRVRSYRPSAPGRLLLCTDGLWRHLPDPGSLRAHAAPAGDLLKAARALVEHAIAAGGQDNITALLIPFRPTDVPRRP